MAAHLPVHVADGAAGLLAGERAAGGAWAGVLVERRDHAAGRAAVGVAVGLVGDEHVGRPAPVPGRTSSRRPACAPDAIGSVLAAVAGAVGLVAVAVGDWQPAGVDVQRAGGVRLRVALHAAHVKRPAGEDDRLPPGSQRGAPTGVATVAAGSPMSGFSRTLRSFCGRYGRRRDSSAFSKALAAELRTNPAAANQ